MTLTRPQPLGAFDLPAGLLLVDGVSAELVRPGLLEGRLPPVWPEDLRGVGLAYEGDVDGAIAWFEADDKPSSKVNLFVLDPARVSREEAAAALGEEWRPFVDYVAFTNGLTSIPPSAAGATGEIAALLSTAQAAAALDDGDEEEAIEHLAQAVGAAREAHPAFAGVALAELAARAYDLDAAEESVALLRRTDLTAHYAEAVYQRAGLVHGLAIEGRRPLQEAIAGYTEALKHLNERDHAALFARAHMNLGIALLAAPVMSASDGLRSGVAIQSLRTAQRILDRTKDEDKEEWALATLSLANALVYAPSAKQRDNVMEAVDLYELVVRERSPKKDPAGRARVLANQGNALAHLGLQADALERFREAEYLFASTGDEGSAQVVRGMRAEVEALA